MEHEFLDLIKTFDKTAKRLGVLDEKVLGFKDILEDLRENLDELVEMVKLEEIIDLASVGALKIAKLNEHYESMMKAHQQVLDLDSLEMITQKKWEHIETQLQEMKNLSHQVLSQTQAPKPIGQTSLIECQNGVYLIQDDQLMWFDYQLQSMTPIVEASSMISMGDLIFVKRENQILMIQNQVVVDELPLSCVCFVVRAYQLYYLVNQQLRRYHLLTKQDELILEGVKMMHPLENQLLLQLTEGYQLLPY